MSFVFLIAQFFLTGRFFLAGLKLFNCITSKLITLAIHFVQFKSVETTMTENTSKNTSSYYPEVNLCNYIPIILVFHLSCIEMFF